MTHNGKLRTNRQLPARLRDIGGETGGERDKGVIGVDSHKARNGTVEHWGSNPHTSTD
jgi:hypothetical protein